MLNKWISLFERYWDSFAQEVNSNVRIYRLVWITALLVCAYVFFFFYDKSSMQSQVLSSLYAQSERSTRIGSVELWQTRETQQKTLKDALQEYCWVANNPPLASADVQTTLQRIISRYEIVNSRLSVATPEVVDESMWRIRAQLRGKLDSGSHYLALLRDLEDLRRFISVERVSLTSTGRGETIDMLVSVCFVREQNG
ncbi:MAG: hypothetical protein JJ952_09865 [Pseudomonadales bacterium]|nr:hypothetical protein [Pseudomonadales bacterium]